MIKDKAKNISNKVVNKYIEVSCVCLNYLIKPISSFMRHLLVIQGIDPNAKPTGLSLALQNTFDNMYPSVELYEKYKPKKVFGSSPFKRSTSNAIFKGWKSKQIELPALTYTQPEEPLHVTMTDKYAPMPATELSDQADALKAAMKDSLKLAIENSLTSFENKKADVEENQLDQLRSLIDCDKDYFEPINVGTNDINSLHHAILELEDNMAFKSMDATITTPKKTRKPTSVKIIKPAKKSTKKISKTKAVKTKVVKNFNGNFRRISEE